MDKLLSTSAEAIGQNFRLLASFAVLPMGSCAPSPVKNLADVIEGFKTADFFKDTSHFLLEDLSLGAKDALNSILCSIDDSESLIQRQTGLLESLDLQL